MAICPTCSSMAIEAGRCTVCGAQVGTIPQPGIPRMIPEPPLNSSRGRMWEPGKGIAGVGVVSEIPAEAPTSINAQVAVPYPSTDPTVTTGPEGEFQHSSSLYPSMIDDAEAQPKIKIDALELARQIIDEMELTPRAPAGKKAPPNQKVRRYMITLPQGIHEEIKALGGVINHHCEKALRLYLMILKDAARDGIIIPLPDMRDHSMLRRQEDGAPIRGGYVYIYCPGHPGAYSNMVRENRLILEQKIGRYLEPGEIAHHINGDKTDNRPENLELMTNKEHSKLHSQQAQEALATTEEEKP